jgi:hypothetical protein
MPDASPFDRLHARLTLLKAHARLGQPGVDSVILLFQLFGLPSEYRHAKVKQIR